MESNKWHSRPILSSDFSKLVPLFGYRTSDGQRVLDSPSSLLTAVLTNGSSYYWAGDTNSRAPYFHYRAYKAAVTLPVLDSLVAVCGPAGVHSTSTTTLNQILNLGIPVFTKANPVTFSNVGLNVSCVEVDNLLTITSQYIFHIRSNLALPNYSVYY